MNKDMQNLAKFNLIGFISLSALITIYAMMLDNKIEQNTGAAHSPITSLSPQAAPTISDTWYELGYSVFGTEDADIPNRRELEEIYKDEPALLALAIDLYGYDDTGYKANVSAYCPCEKCCGEFADGVTASGHVIQKGDKFVAAPKDIPFGTMIDIPGYGRVPVLDRGGAIKGNKLDVFFPTHEEALQWGRQYLTVKIGE